jgi:hypothetical protein
MRGFAALAASVLALLVSLPAAAQSGAQPVIRRLVYDVRSSSTLRKEERQSGLGYLNQATRQIVNESSGGNFNSATFSMRNSGRMEIDIVAVTRDGGLVADVRLSGDNVNMGKTRIAILSDGVLGYNPALELPVEVQHVLPLLGREVIAGHAVGDLWKMPLRGKNVKGDNTFRITGEAGAEKVNVEMTTSMQITGTPHVDESSRTTAVYSSRLTNPISVSYTGLLHKRSTTQVLETIDLTVDATLVEDTFASR